MHSSSRQWHYEILDPKSLDRKELLSFLREEYGTADAAQSDYFDWYCLMNPLGRAVMPAIRDPESGQLVAQIWLIPLRARIQGQAHSCALGVNYLVHRDHRREGIMRSMRSPTAEQLRQRAIEFGIGFPNPKMVNALETYRDSSFIGPLDIFARPLDWSLLETTRLERFPLRTAIQALARTVWPLLFRHRPVDHVTSSLNIRETRDYGSLFDDFWERVQDKYPVMLVRDSEFLRWRYQLHPRRRYVTFVAEEGGMLVGYIVIRCTRVLGVRLGAIVDFLVAPSQRGEEAGNVLVAQATSYFQARRRQLIACVLAPAAREKSILRRQGFVAVPRSLHPQPVTMSITPYVDTLPLSTICDVRNWFLTLGDYDII